jgi:hypothetical protein
VCIFRFLFLYPSVLLKDCACVVDGCAYFFPVSDKYVPFQMTTSSEQQAITVNIQADSFLFSYFLFLFIIGSVSLIFTQYSQDQ